MTADSGARVQVLDPQRTDSQVLRVDEVRRRYIDADKHLAGRVAGMLGMERGSHADRVVFSTLATIERILGHAASQETAVLVASVE